MCKHIFKTIFFLFVSITYAQDISIKNRGNVNVNNGHFIEYPLKPSSLVEQIYYDEPNQYLIVSLNGTFYHYCSIPVEEVNAWVDAPSLADYYKANVEGKYDCQINPTPEYR